MPFSLAATKSIINLFSFPAGTKMFQFPAYISLSRFPNLATTQDVEKQAYAGNWNILVPAGKENINDAPISSERKGQRANWISFWKEGRDVVSLAPKSLIKVGWKAAP